MPGKGDDQDYDNNVPYPFGEGSGEFAVAWVRYVGALRRLLAEPPSERVLDAFLMLRDAALDALEAPGMVANLAGSSGLSRGARPQRRRGESQQGTEEIFVEAIAGHRGNRDRQHKRYSGRPAVALEGIVESRERSGRHIPRRIRRPLRWSYIARPLG